MILIIAMEMIGSNVNKYINNQKKIHVIKGGVN